jgi:hypothetical protein
MPNDVYLEVGGKRVFACSLDWPGWCRAGRDEDAALEALTAYAPRYQKAVASAGKAFKDSPLRVVERVKGNATTDFGAPGLPASADDRPLSAAELKRQTSLLRASWAAFDRRARSAQGTKLRKGPRGGGRDLDKIVRHVLEADLAYLSKLGAKSRNPASIKDVKPEMAAMRKEMVGLLASRAKGEPPPRTPRSGSLWPPRYAIRRSAWHALDHAWEIEDRVMTR